MRAELRGKAEGVLVGGTYLATRRPATERSEGAQLGAPPEPNSADEEDPLRRTGDVVIGLRDSDYRVASRVLDA